MSQILFGRITTAFNGKWCDVEEDERHTRERQQWALYTIYPVYCAWADMYVTRFIYLFIKPMCNLWSAKWFIFTIQHQICVVKTYSHTRRELLAGWMDGVSLKHWKKENVSYYIRRNFQSIIIIMRKDNNKNCGGCYWRKWREFLVRILVDKKVLPSPHSPP